MMQRIGGPGPARTAWRWAAVGGSWWRRWCGAFATLAHVEAGAAPPFLALLVTTTGLGIALQ